MIRIFAGLMVAGFALLAAPAHADTNGARQYADAIGQKVLAVLDSPGMAADGKQQQLRQIFGQNVDIPWMGKFVLGRNWQQASPEQQQRYLAAYERFLLTHYTENFSDYSGSKYTITGVADSGNGQYTVNMKIKSPKQQQATEAGYLLQDAGGGQFKIRDIIIEGVSLITTQRSEFSSVVQRDGIAGLITDLENRAQGGA